MAHQSNNPTWTNSATTPINAQALENIETGIDSLALGNYGGLGRTRTYAGYVYYTADSSSLVAGTDYIMAGGWGLYSDPDGMVSLGGGTISTPVTITIPVTGMYQADFHGVSSALSGYIYARMLINADTSQTVSYRVVNNSCAIAIGPSSSEATHFHLTRPRLFNAGDRVTAAIYSTAAFVLKSTFFAQPYVTMFGVRFLGPA